MPGYTPSPESLGAGGVTATPHTGSIAKIEAGEEAFSPTTTGTHRAIRNPLTSRRTTTSGSVPKVRPKRSRRRSGWIPDQHGAWAMVVVPFWCGVAWSQMQWATVPLFLFWFFGYFCFYSTSLWLRSGRKERYWPPVRAWGLVTMLLGLITVLLAPPVLEWSLVFAPLVVIMAWQSWIRRERSLLARTSTVLAAGLMCLVSYDLGTGFSRTGLSASWLQHSPGDAAPTMATAPSHSSLEGWAWMAFLALALTAYFWSTVPYVKTLVREYTSRGYLVFSMGAHVVFTGLATLAAAAGWCSILLPLTWLALTVRAIVLPLWSRRTKRRINARTIGWGEVVVTVAMLLALHV